MINLFQAPSEGQSTDPALSNAAVARCCDAGVTARRAAIAKGFPDYKATTAARDAYRKSMPPLSGSENIRDFVACVAHGMLIEVFSNTDSAKLLYAAQVAGGIAKKREAAPPASA